MGINMSKYNPLWEYIRDNGNDDYKLSFDESRNVLGFEIDHSFLTYKKELGNYGYEVAKISMKDRFVMIKKK